MRLRKSFESCSIVYLFLLHFITDRKLKAEKLSVSPIGGLWPFSYPYGINVWRLGRSATRRFPRTKTHKFKKNYPLPGTPGLGTGVKDENTNEKCFSLNKGLDLSEDLKGRPEAGFPS